MGDCNTLKTFPIPHHCDPHFDQTKYNDLLPLTIDGVLSITTIDTMSYAAFRAADLDWIVGLGYSSGRKILGCSKCFASHLRRSDQIGSQLTSWESKDLLLPTGAQTDLLEEVLVFRDSPAKEGNFSQKWDIFVTHRQPGSRLRIS